MIIEQIKDEYAKEQGYEDWTHLLAHHILVSSDEIDNHINSVIQLIQDELKKKIANIEDIKIEHVDEFGDYIDVIGTEKQSILNTENIK
ncbi:hypothetical protein [Empedobacter sp.]|uniref:hypothetical protein n=1 Tax=Empedobacter sp. TaxID=1927715 RepID=UPI0028974A45|nr:hypothetical protein [Empedobacter sp.]